ncbi:MAG TPA: nucleotidyltransferase family protein [Candidatus Omnitrophota bacterium]|nr:nucleotidyltransferase family protein [Candidatus Omnitrophota bacterium]
MRVLILAAGYGTRLYPVIQDTAKPLLPVASRPIIDYLLEKTQPLPDLREVVVVTNEKFYKDFLDWAELHKDFPAPIVVMNDGTTSPEDRLGAVGDILFVLKNSRKKDALFVLGGDNLFDYSLGEFIRFAQGKAPHVSIGLYDIRDLKAASNFGVVQMNDQSRIELFEEKPSRPRSTLIAMCSYFFPEPSQPLIFDYVAKSKKTDKSGDYIHWLTEMDQVFGFKFEGEWYDIGSIETYRSAQEKFKV